MYGPKPHETFHRGWFSREYICIYGYISQQRSKITCGGENPSTPGYYTDKGVDRAAFPRQLVAPE